MSQEVLKSELSLFSKVNYQKSVESSEIIQFRPTSALNESNIVEFDLSVANDEYLDLQNIFLCLKAKIVQKDGTDFPATLNNRYSMINYGLNTIFDQLSIYIGSTLISQSANVYPYLSYIEAITETTPQMIDTYMQTSGLVSAFKADSYDFDAIDSKLSKLTNESKIFYLYGNLHGVIFKTDKLLLNGVGVRLIFNRASDKFSLMGLGQQAATASNVAVAKAEPKLNVLDISVFARKVKVNPALLEAHQKALQISRAIYPLKRSIVKVFNLPSGQNTFMVDNCVMGQMPSRLILGVVTNDAFSGDYKLNPLKFFHHNLNYLAFHINGEIFPRTPYQPDYQNNNYQREYFEFFLNIGATRSMETPAICYATYKTGYCLYALNFNADFETTSEWISMPKSGFLHIDVKFKENLNNALKLICYLKYDSILEIDYNRNVFIDYN